MYRIKLKRTSKKEFDEIIEIEKEEKAYWTYWQYMKDNYFFGELIKVNGNKEENIGSFCKSEFA